MPVAASTPFPVLCLAGATASGKTSLALAMAKALGGAIINADSRQIYADFPLICAQPTPEEQAQAPHYLYGILPSTAKISAGEWCHLAHDAIVSARKQHLVPILVGGTGMYFQALLHGIVPIPPIDPALRATLEARMDAEGPLALYGELEACDPSYAKSIHQNDRQRIVRALEVFHQTGHPFSWWHHQKSLQQPFCQGPLYVIAASLDWLEPRIRARIDSMMESGALKEAKEAFARCPNTEAPAWSGIGCWELLAYLRGRVSLDEALALWCKHTRAYAKRQNTWFRGRKEAIFFQPKQEADLLAHAVQDWDRLQKGVFQG
ncbi:MAG: tRNA (adenosine(37)-N6)-dimethylallyltransferase MiaA [Desulfovibrio sp.]|nr:tRNA (adenosine(37)-N6)-dimethylallyltransferase MiaA [Desulfovibrio sp.]